MKYIRRRKYIEVKIRRPINILLDFGSAVTETEFPFPSSGFCCISLRGLFICSAGGTASVMSMFNNESTNPALRSAALSSTISEDSPMS